MLNFGGWLGEGVCVTFQEDSPCEASPPFPTSDKLEYCLEATAKKPAQSSSSSCPAILQLGEKGGLFPPPSFAHTELPGSLPAHTPGLFILCSLQWEHKLSRYNQPLKLGCLPLTSQYKYYFICLMFNRNAKTFHPSNTKDSYYRPHNWPIFPF